MKKYLVLIFIFLATSFINGQNNWWFFDDDREAPSAPTSLFVGGLQNKDSLTWTDPTALDFDSVRIYRETWYGSGVYSWQYSVAKGVQVKIDSALTPDSVYRYKLYAKDYSGNISSASSTAFDTVKPILYAIDLDGSTEYASKTSPVNLDLNGAETVLKDSNSTFESTDTTDWTGAGNALMDTTSGGKYAGTYSLLLTQSGNGDSTTNYGSLAAAYFGTFAVGSKVTIEFWKQSLWTASKDTIVFVWGSKSKKDTVGVYWSKFVYNVQVTSAEVGQVAKIYMISASGDTSRIDNFSITQAKDLMVNVWFKNTSGSAGSQRLMTRITAIATTGIGYALFTSSDGKLNFYLEDAQTERTVLSTSNVRDNNWHLATITYNVTATAGTKFVLSIDGATNESSETSPNNVANTTNTQALAVGRNNYSSAAFWNGQIAETQITTFTDIADATYTPSEIYYRSKAGFRFPTNLGGTIVASYHWEGADASTMLTDKSGTGNSLTGTNVDLTDRVTILGY